MAAVPPKCNFKCWLPDINLARHTERKRLREKEREDKDTGEQAER